MLYRSRPSKVSLANLPIWLFVALAWYSQACYSNGWEHTSIDIEVLFKALDDSNPNVRRHAAESLGFRRGDAAAGALLERLEKNEPVASVRREIFKALGKLGAESALAAIEDCLQKESDLAVRTQCAGSLGHFESTQAEQLALQSVHDTEMPVRLQAASSLGSFSSPGVLEALTELTREYDDSIRHTALLSLGRTGSAAATPILVESLENSSSRAEILVLLQALTLLANPGAIGVIQRVYERSDDEEVRRYALVAMANTRARGSESYFLESLSSESTASRALGLTVLRNFASRHEVPVIIEHALDDSNFLFTSDVERLLKQPSQTLSDLQLLNEYLKTIIRLAPDTGERLFVMASTPRPIPRTSPAALKIAQEFYRARWQSIYGLGYTGSKQAAEIVEAALSDSDARIRAVATRSMGVLGNPEYLDSIESMLKDEAAEVRWVAARVLGRLESAGTAGALIRALNDTHPQVRLESAIALGYLKAQRAQPRLSELAAKDPDPRVKEAALYAASVIE